MACSSCKRNIVVAEKGVDIPTPSFEKKGVKFILGKAWDIVTQIFFRLFVVAIILLLVPIILVMLCFNILFRGKNVITLPKKMIDLMSKKKEE